MKRVYRAKETWTRIIAECRASSLSDAEWCRQNGIKRKMCMRGLQQI